MKYSKLNKTYFNGSVPIFLAQYGSKYVIGIRVATNKPLVHLCPYVLFSVTHSL